MHATRFVERYFDAWNNRDPKGVADHLAADGVYCDVPQNWQRSHDALITKLRAFFSHDRHQYELLGDMTLRGDAAIKITDYYDIRVMAEPAADARATAVGSQQRKYAKSGLKASQLEEFKSRLDTTMQSDKVFLRSDLTLPALAAAIDCSINHLSQVINSGFGMSFFDYLNQHRIEYARKLLGEYDGNNCAILNVAFAAGFNSNSAFYAAFRKCTGQTPAQYRRALLRKPH